MRGSGLCESYKCEKVTPQPPVWHMTSISHRHIPPDVMSEAENEFVQVGVGKVRGLQTGAQGTHGSHFIDSAQCPTLVAKRTFKQPYGDTQAKEAAVWSPGKCII